TRAGRGRDARGVLRLPAAHRDGPVGAAGAPARPRRPHLTRPRGTGVPRKHPRSRRTSQAPAEPARLASTRGTRAPRKHPRNPRATQAPAAGGAVMWSGRVRVIHVVGQLDPSGDTYLART